MNRLGWRSLLLATLLPVVVVLLAPSRPAVAGPGSTEWSYEREHGPFAVRSDRPFKEAEQIEAELFQLRDDVEETLGLTTVPDVSEPRIQITLFSSDRDYRKHLATRSPEGAGRPACFIQGSDLGRVYVVRQGDWLKHLRHETTHAMLHQALPYVPTWLDEGLAVHFEAPRETRDRKHHFLAAMKWQTRLGWKPDLTALEAREELTEMRPADYRQSWAWVHFLLHESDETKTCFLGYLQEIESGVPPGPLSLVLRDEMPDASARLVRHIENWKK